MVQETGPQVSLPPLTPEVAKALEERKNFGQKRLPLNLSPRVVVPFILGLGNILSACAPVEPTHTPIIPPTPSSVPTRIEIPQPTLTETPTTTPKPTDTPRPTETQTQTATPEPSKTPTPTPEPTPVPKEMVTRENVDIFMSAGDEKRAGYIIPGKTFKILEEKTLAGQKWLRISQYSEEFKTSWERWIKASETAYGLPGEVSRTEKGRLGILTQGDGTETQMVDPDRRVQPHTGVNFFEEFLFGDNDPFTPNTTPEKILWGGKITSFDSKTGELVVLNRGETIRLLVNSKTKLALWLVFGTSVSNMESTSLSQFRAGDVIYFWVFNEAFNPTGLSEVAAMVEIK